MAANLQWWALPSLYLESMHWQLQPVQTHLEHVLRSEIAGRTGQRVDVLCSLKGAAAFCHGAKKTTILETSAAWIYLSVATHVIAVYIQFASVVSIACLGLAISARYGGVLVSFVWWARICGEESLSCLMKINNMSALTVQARRHWHDQEAKDHQRSNVCVCVEFKNSWCWSMHCMFPAPMY